jgi:hypothetical protein
MPTFSQILQKRYDEKTEQAALYLLQAGQPDQPVTYSQLLSGSAAYARLCPPGGATRGDRSFDFPTWH